MSQEFTFTHHALSRALDMSVSAEELLACLERPEVTYQQADRGRDGVYEVRQRGSIALAIRDRVVLSVLHRTVHVYDRADDGKQSRKRPV